MAVHLDLILSWDATPAQLRAVGAALWRWCRDTETDGDGCQCLNNQALADLIAGTFPAPGRLQQPQDGRGVHVRIWETQCLDQQANLASLRHALPHTEVAAVLIDGARWDRIDPAAPAFPARPSPVVEPANPSTR